MAGFNIPLDTYSRDNCEPRSPRSSSAISSNIVFPKRGGSNTTESVRGHRFKVVIDLDYVLDGSGLSSARDEVDTNFLKLYARKCQRPAVEFDVITIHQGAEEIYRPGKYRWNTVDVTFYEPIESEDKKIDVNAKNLYYWWRFGVMTDKHWMQNLRAINATMNVYSIDGNSDQVHQYTLHNCWPTKVAPTDFDYSDTNLGEITATFRYDYATESGV